MEFIVLELKVGALNMTEHFVIIPTLQEMILSYVQIAHSGKILTVSLKISRVKDALEQCNIVTFPMPTGRFTHMSQILQCTQGHVGIYQTEYLR